MGMMMMKKMMMKIVKLKKEMYEDDYKRLKITPGQIPVKIDKKIFYVKPAIVEHDLLAPGGRTSPPRFGNVGGGGGGGPPPPGSSGTIVEPRGPKGDKGDKGDNVTRR